MCVSHDEWFQYHRPKRNNWSSSITSSSNLNPDPPKIEPDIASESWRAEFAVISFSSSLRHKALTTFSVILDSYTSSVSWGM